MYLNWFAKLWAGSGGFGLIIITVFYAVDLLWLSLGFINRKIIQIKVQSWFDIFNRPQSWDIIHNEIKLIHEIDVQTTGKWLFRLISCTRILSRSLNAKSRGWSINLSISSPYKSRTLLSITSKTPPIKRGAFHLPIDLLNREIKSKLPVKIGVFHKVLYPHQ